MNNDLWLSLLENAEVLHAKANPWHVLNMEPMKTKTLKVFIVLSFHLLTVNAIANETCSIKNANDIIRCLQKKHPEVINDETIRNVSDKLENQGKAWKNPEVSFETVGGQSLGSNIYESELRLSQTIEFSGQHNARKNIAHATMEQFKAESLGKLEDITILGIKSVYRLAQIKNEIEKIEESIKQFKKIKNQFQSRLKLTPEQEITFGVIQLGISEFEIKRNQILSEKKEIIAELTSNTEISSEEIQKNLPAPIKNWPARPSVENISSASMLKLKADRDMAGSSLALAKAEAWPEFTVDLIVQNKIEGSDQYQLYGAGIRLPFPIFQRNQGEKSLKAVEFSRAQNLVNANQIRSERIVENLSQTYDDSVRNLQNTPSEDFVEKKHRKAEQLFAQGLISGPLIIETYRQIIDYTESRNIEEMRAIESLWKLYILKGNYLEKNIE